MHWHFLQHQTSVIHRHTQAHLPVPCQSLLSALEYDDYDRLVQFTDRLFEGFTMIPFAERAQAIGRRYHLSDAIVDKLIKDGQFLKNYLDRRCGEDVYKIIGLA